MKTTYSKYVIEADSLNNKYGLLLNKKNDYFKNKIFLIEMICWLIRALSFNVEKIAS